MLPLFLYSLKPDSDLRNKALAFQLFLGPRDCKIGPLLMVVASICLCVRECVCVCVCVCPSLSVCMCVSPSLSLSLSLSFSLSLSVCLSGCLAHWPLSFHVYVCLALCHTKRFLT